MSQQYDLVIVGCGPAGEAAALLASDYRKRVAVVDERPAGVDAAGAVDGRLAFFALREASMFASGLHSTPLPGGGAAIEPGCPLAELLAPRLALKNRDHDRLKSSLDRPAIDVLRGRATLVNSRTVEVAGADGTMATLQADRILIATGSRTSFPGHLPADHPCVVDHRRVLSLDRLPASLVVVGSDVISFAYASVFAGLGVDVTLVSPEKEALGFIDVECRDHLALAMKHTGVAFRFGTNVEAVDDIKDSRIRLVLDKGQPVETDVMLWNASHRAETGDLHLEKAGITTDDAGFIAIDEHGRTSCDSVFAAGEVAGGPALASASLLQARQAVSAMFDMPLRRRADHIVPTSVYTIPSVACVGVSEWEAREAETPVVTGRALLQFNARGLTVGDGHGILKCVFHRETQKLLGATIVGRDAGELIHLAQHVLIADGGIEDFVGMSFNQPTLSELYHFAAYAALQSLARLEQRDDDLGGLARVA